MQGQNSGKRLKNLRNKQGISQEYLAEQSGLSIRTIQRIEKGETTPNGDTCRKLSEALKVSPNELMDWSVVEDIDFLKKLNLSALTFVFFPLLGIVVPAIMWVSKKDKVKYLDNIAKKLLNSQITFVILLFIIPFILFPFLFRFLEIFAEVFHEIFNIYLLPGSYSADQDDIRVVWILMYITNVYFIIMNTFRIHDGKKIKYFPSIGFLKN